MNKDLKFIAQHVTEWPDGAETVRLDRDGEICFMGCGIGYDFFPEGGADHFCGECGVVEEYTKQEWIVARKQSCGSFHNSDDGDDAQQKRLIKVLERLIELAKDDEDFAEAFSNDLETLLDDVGENDGFGTEGHSDPRGDFRGGDWSMWNVEGVDNE